MARSELPPRIGGRSPRRGVSTCLVETGSPKNQIIVVVVVVVVVSLVMVVLRVAVAVQRRCP